jgi:hypothetical protein
MSNRGQNLPFTPFRPLAWFLIGSFTFVLSFRALSFPLFTSLKRCLPFCKLFARNFHFKRLYCLIQYFLYLGGYLLTTGQIYGFFAALPTVCSLSHINGKTPALFSGAFMPIVLYRFRTSHLSNDNAIGFHGGWCIPFPLSLSLLPNIPGRAFHLPEIPG